MKSVAIVGSQDFKIRDGYIQFTIKPRHGELPKETIRINLASYVLEMLDGVKPKSITLTPEKLIITYEKEIESLHSDRWTGIDRNLDNATSFDTNGRIMIYDLSKTNKIKATYGEVKSHFKRNDVRIRRKICVKYGRKEKNRVHQALHKVSKKIVERGQGIILEDLKGIGNTHRRGNGKGKESRFKLNGWSHYELSRQIEYKARWKGIPVKYVKPMYTSSKCAECGSKLKPEEHRMMNCTHCNIHVDRDVNAAKNILARGLRFGPDGGIDEAMVSAVKRSVDMPQCVLS